MKDTTLFSRGSTLVLSLVVALAACGDDGDSNTTAPTTSTLPGATEGDGSTSTGSEPTTEGSSTGDPDPSAGSSSGDTSGGSSGGGESDPNYPKPDATTCPDGFVFQSVAGGGVFCAQTCPNDGADTCMMGATGTALPWCSFPSDDASNDDCSMDAESCPDGETCIEFAGDVAICRDMESRCGLQCSNGETCPDGMECDTEMAGGFCVYR